MYFLVCNAFVTVDAGVAGFHAIDVLLARTSFLVLGFHGIEMETK